MEAIERFGVNPQITHWMLENHHYPLDHLARFVTFSFVHGSMINTAVSCALFLAMGKMVGSAFSPLALLVFLQGQRPLARWCFHWLHRRVDGFLVHLQVFMALSGPILL